MHGFSASYALGSILYDLFTGRVDGKEAAGMTADAMFNNLFPIDMGGLVNREGKIALLPWPRPLVPTLAVPFYDVAVNEDFAGRYIRREPFTIAQDRTAANSQLYRPNVNDLIRSITDGLFELTGGDKELGKNYFYDEKGRRRKVSIDLNPSVIEHYLEGLLSGKGQFYNQLYKSLLEPVVTGGWNTVAKGEPLGESMKEAYQDVTSWDIPIVNRFYRSPSVDPIFDKYREQKMVASGIIETWNAHKAIGKIEEFNATTGQKQKKQAEQVRNLQKKIDDYDEKLRTERLSDSLRNVLMGKKRDLMRKVNEIEFGK
jgi:hypothetical protein